MSFFKGYIPWTTKAITKRWIEIYFFIWRLSSPLAYTWFFSKPFFFRIRLLLKFSLKSAHCENTPRKWFRNTRKFQDVLSWCMRIFVRAWNAMGWCNYCPALLHLDCRHHSSRRIEERQEACELQVCDGECEDSSAEASFLRVSSAFKYLLCKLK